MDEHGQECRHCGEFRPWEEFKADRRLPSGYTTLCKDCYNTRARDRYAERLEAQLPSSEELEAQRLARRDQERARRAAVAELRETLAANHVVRPPGWKPPWAVEFERKLKEAASPSPPPPKPTEAAGAAGESKPKRKSKFEVVEGKEPAGRDPWGEEDHWNPWPGGSQW
jgi:hypothetical protein